MHAILGYAASELMANDASLAAAAMDHRVKAIRAIKRTLADVGSRAGDLFEEGNALIATCFALTYQSVLLDDGLAEYMTFIRGVVIVAIQMYTKGARILFPNLLGDRQKALLEPHMRALPPIKRDWADRAVASIRALEPLCSGEGRELERRYWELILAMGEKLSVSSWDGACPPSLPSSPLLSHVSSPRPFPLLFALFPLHVLACLSVCLSVRLLAPR